MKVTPPLARPEKILQNVSSSFQEFYRTGALSGILLLIAAIGAMIWANSAWSEVYFNIWNIPLGVSVADFHLEKPLIFWVNDGLMGLFFFYIGLEIKREIKVGELSRPGQAVLPVIAAMGGITFPAALFLLFTWGTPGAEGWGVPMATDIAFSLGLLMLLGKRVPDSLKIFLTAFAIVDDLAAVLIIALFYSGELQTERLLLASGLYMLMWAFNLLQVRAYFIYYLLATAMWYFFLKGGVHPTVAGILAALAIPANSKIRMNRFVEKTREAINHFWDEKSNALKQFLSGEQLNAIDLMDDNIEKVLPPLQRLEHALTGVVAYFIMPVFALANAGVRLQSEGNIGTTSQITWFILLSLVLGKVAGITIFTRLGVALKLAKLPTQTNWMQIVGIGFLGGVGFTMALFIASLAFDDPGRLAHAKLGILLGSLLAGVLGIMVLMLSLPKKKSSDFAAND